jgi:hypothetical protein
MEVIELSNALVPYFLLEPGRLERTRRPGERTSDSQANRRSHIGVVVAMIGKGARLAVGALLVLKNILVTFIRMYH